MTVNVLRTSKEWYDRIRDKIEICDPDGWRRLNEDYFNLAYITETEFKYRLYKSSCIFKDMKFIKEYLKL